MDEFLVCPQPLTCRDVGMEVALLQPGVVVPGKAVRGGSARLLARFDTLVLPE